MLAEDDGDDEGDGVEALDYVGAVKLSAISPLAAVARRHLHLVNYLLLVLERGSGGENHAFLRSVGGLEAVSSDRRGGLAVAGAAVANGHCEVVALYMKRPIQIRGIYVNQIFLKHHSSDRGIFLYERCKSNSS